MIPFFLISLFLSGAMSQIDMCEPAVNPSPSCLCTRLDFMDTYSFRLRFGNSTMAGSNYVLTPPSFNSNYDCTNPQPLRCGAPASQGGKVQGFAVFNMEHILWFAEGIPSVFCYPNIRMFDMDKSLVKINQETGELPDIDLHLTEVGCIEYGGTNTGVTLPTTTTTENPEGCTCSRPPPVMTQAIFDMQFAFNIPQTTFTFGVPRFTYTVGCQHVSMVCPTGQKAIMFFNNKYILNGNDIVDVAFRFNLHCHSASAKWMFDEPSEQKFKSLLGIGSIELSYLGCASFVAKS
uniref:CUB domain-containing protein n=1 Tax=Caenorhabditis tropicalis TaxID=1561998 RepID=A0A1I7V4D3_9PELO